MADRARRDRAGRPGPRAPRDRRRTRLVTRTVTSGQAASSSATRGRPPITCSKLSSTSRRRVPRRTAFSRSMSGSSPASRTPSALMMAEATRAGSLTGASGTKVTPSGKVVRRLGRHCEREPGLADAARAGQGQQPHLLPAQAGAERGHLRLAADQEGVGGTGKGSASSGPPAGAARVAPRPARPARAGRWRPGAARAASSRARASASRRTAFGRGWPGSRSPGR